MSEKLPSVQGEKRNAFESWLSPKNTCDYINLLNAELNPICHMLALLGAHHILHISRIRVKLQS